MPDDHLSDEAVAEPGTSPYFLFECMGLDGETIFIISNGTSWNFVRRRYAANQALYKITPTVLRLTTTDQESIVTLINEVCKNATQAT